MGKFYVLLNKQLEANTIVFGAPAISGLSLAGGFEIYVQDRNNGTIQDLEKYTNLIVAKANQRPELTRVNSMFNPNIPQYFITLDREKAKSMGVNVSDVFITMQSVFGQYYVNDFNLYGKTYQVNIQAESEFRKSPEDLSRVFVKSNKGDLVPVSSLVEFERVTGADIVDRFNLFMSAKITGQAKGDYSSGDALRAIEEVAKEVLPQGYTIAYSGSSYKKKMQVAQERLPLCLGLFLCFSFYVRNMSDGLCLYQCLLQCLLRFLVQSLRPLCVGLIMTYISKSGLLCLSPYRLKMRF